MQEAGGQASLTRGEPGAATPTFLQLWTGPGARLSPRGLWGHLGAAAWAPPWFQSASSRAMARSPQ